MSGQANAHMCEGSGSGKIMKSVIWGTMIRFAFAAAAMITAASLGPIASSTPARADYIYAGSGGIGFSFGTGVSRNGFYYGSGRYYGRGGFYGPPYRPYGAPYYYHPYDSRAYPYRSRVYPNRSRVRIHPPVELRGAQRVPHTKTGIPPFTADWVAYCARKFKSFDPNTGTYLAYSGKYRFCR